MASRKVSFGRRVSSSRSGATNASNIGGVTVPSSDSEPRANSIAVREDSLIVDFADGRMLSVPLERFPRLVAASTCERQNYELIGDGTLVHWPGVDEDIDVRKLLIG